MTGSLRQKNGKFFMRISFKNEKGEWKQKQVATDCSVRNEKKKAEKMLKEYLEKNSDESLHKSNQILFTDYLKQWLENKRGNVENNTLESYKQLVEKHIIPYFKPKQLKVKEVKAKHIIDFYDLKSKSGRLDGKEGGVSPRILKYFSTIFSQVFKKAVLEQIIDNHPSINVPIPKQESKIKIGKFLEADEAQRLIYLFEGHILKPIVILALYYGLRRSEILGLKWEAIDFKNESLEIKHTVLGFGSNIEKRNRTKNASSYRTLALIPEIKNLFLELKLKQRKNKSIFGNTYQNSDYVFTWEDGRLLRPDYITKGFQKILKRSELKKIRFHDLRHSCASFLYDKGWHEKDVQQWLGHSDIKTTMDIYTHISQQRKSNMAKSLSGTFSLVAG